MSNMSNEAYLAATERRRRTRTAFTEVTEESWTYANLHRCSVNNVASRSRIGSAQMNPLNKIRNKGSQRHEYYVNHAPTTKRASLNRRLRRRKERVHGSRLRVRVGDTLLSRPAL